MGLDERKRQILQAIIEGYISTAEPIGSRTIAKNSELNLSAATIRNEMGDLEEMGLLIQPHTSAGRVPSQLGYRLYVDSLMQKYKMTAAEISRLRSAMMLKIEELDKTVRKLSAVFSGITNMPTVATLPTVERGRVNSIKVVMIDPRTLMVIIAAGSNILKNKLLRLSSEVDAEFVEKLNVILSENLVGLTKSEISLDNIMQVQSAVGGNFEILTAVLELVHEAISELDNSEVILEGVTNILRFPEYNDIERVKELLGFFEDKEHLGKLIRDNARGGLSVIIGEESNIPELKENSIVLSSYELGDGMKGFIGIIGPVRMNYSRAVSSLEYYTKQVEKTLRGKFFESALRDSEVDNDGK